MAGLPAITGGAGGELTLSDAEFVRLQSLLRDRFGIHVDASKRTLVASKVSRLVRTGGYATFEAYESAELQGRMPGGLSDFIDQLTTNHTYWWRESAHFDLLRKSVLPELEARLARERDLRVWCAVSSTGEEAWTLAMLLRSHFGPRYSSWKAGLLASDISARALGVAVQGEYEADDVAPLPSDLSRYLQPSGDGNVRVVNALRSDVTFRRLNLMSHPWPFRRRMHVVFCRNVMIYFDRPTIERLTRALYEAIEPGGYLFVGHSEPLPRASCPFEMVGPSVYRRRP